MKRNDLEFHLNWASVARNTRRICSSMNKRENLEMTLFGLNVTHRLVSSICSVHLLMLVYLCTGRWRPCFIASRDRLKTSAQERPDQEGQSSQEEPIPCPFLPDLVQPSAPSVTTPQGPVALGDDDVLLSIFFVVRSEKKKWVAWLPMILFTLDDKKIISLSSSANGPSAQERPGQEGPNSQEEPVPCPFLPDLVQPAVPSPSTWSMDRGHGWLTFDWKAFFFFDV